MAKTRSLPDKFYDKDYEHNGIHRVPLWRIAGYALNNTATNVYLMMMNYATYYLMGWVGVGMMVASSLTMMMRIWDGVTDPFVGFMVDKTNGKFGKNRPFIVIGQIILCVTSWVAFHVTHKLPQGVRFPFYVVVLMVYYLGYTCQCVVTKSAQSCVTNDPKQRPMFASFDGVYNTVLFAGLAVITANLELVAAGVATYQNLGIFTETFMFCTYLWIGGIGCTLSLCLLMMTICKSSELKALGRACIVPGIFNINEPIIFGAIAWNPLLMLPMWIQGIILPIVTYLFTKVIPFAPIPRIQFDLWYCPYPISTFISTQGSITGVIFAILTFVLSAVIWFPFVKAYDDQKVKEETAAIKA